MSGLEDGKRGMEALEQSVRKATTFLRSRNIDEEKDDYRHFCKDKGEPRYTPVYYLEQ